MSPEPKSAGVFRLPLPQHLDFIASLHDREGRDLVRAASAVAGSTACRCSTMLAGFGTRDGGPPARPGTP